MAARDATVPSAFLAGGTTLLDLMKLGVLQPQRLIDLGALRAQECGDGRPGVTLRVVPQPGVVRRNPALRRHRGRLGHHQACAAHGATAQMHQMPGSGHPVDGAVLAHRRHRDAVAQLETALLER